MQPYQQQPSDASTGYPSQDYQAYLEEQAYPVQWRRRRRPRFDIVVPFIFPFNYQPYYPYYPPYPYPYYPPYPYPYYGGYLPVSGTDE